MDQKVAMPQTSRAVAELAAMQTDRLTAESTKIAAVGDPASKPAPTATGEAKVGGEAFVLPPVPPPLARGGEAPKPVEPSETESF